MDLVNLLDPVQFVVVTTLTLLLPVYVLFIVFVVRPRRKWRAHRGGRLVLYGLVAFVVCDSVLFGVVTALQALTALSGTLPTMLPFAVRVRPVAFDAPLPAGYHRFNPAVLTLDAGSGAARGRAHLVALRESTYSNCADEHYINVRSDNRVFVGASTAAAAGEFRLCTVYEGRGVAGGGAHRGYQDGRLFALGRTLVNGTPAARVGITLAVHHYMHVGEFAVRVDAAGACHVAHVHEPVPVHLRGTPPNTKQKNWMHLPPYPNPATSTTTEGTNNNGNDTNDSSNDGTEAQRPRFVQWINPLTVVALNTSTGVAETVARAPHSAAFSDSLRGSTNFLRHPREPHRLFALVHNRDESRALVVVPYYTSAILEIHEHANGTYSLAAVSHNFRLPAASNATISHRIHFPMSLAYADSSMQDIDIAMGYMDCTAHIVTVRTEDFLRAVESSVDAPTTPSPDLPSQNPPSSSRRRA